MCDDVIFSGGFIPQLSLFFKKSAKTVLNFLKELQNSFEFFEKSAEKLNFCFKKHEK